MTPNWFSFVALLIWPLVALYLYATRPPTQATVATILGGLLLLPSGAAIKIEMLPALDKNSIPNLCAFTGCLLLAPRRKARPRLGIAEILIALYVAGPFVTSSLNNDPIISGNRFMPGVGSYDAISATLAQGLFFLPFLLGRRFLCNAEDIKKIIRALALSGLLYSLPVLFEIRMSPQLSNWLYGYFPLSFMAEARYGGFRPVVFMANGLVLAFFLMTSFLAALTLWRLRSPMRYLPLSGVTVYLGFIVVLCKSAGALAYSALVGPVLLWSRPRSQLKLAVLLVSISLLYPTLRLTNLFPDQILINVAAFFDQERADSLKFRFDQEEQLLARASERFLFGWGRYGRNRVYDNDSGKDLSVTDGTWIVTIGQFGFLGFLAQFGLLALPVFRSVSAFKRTNSKSDKAFLATLAIILAVTVVEQIPNASISPWTWLLAGSLLGRTELLNSARRTVPAARQSPTDASGYPSRV
jgi:hypothetical protein